VKLASRATCKKESMWQSERAATNISSGSTAASTAHLPTTCGEADAGTAVPPVKAQRVASAVTALKEVLAAGQLPIDVRRIGCHRFPLSQDAIGWDTIYQTPVAMSHTVKLPHIYLVASSRDHQGIPPRQFTDRLLILGDRENYKSVVTPASPSRLSSSS
jgi:hypothetical protein